MNRRKLLKLLALLPLSSLWAGSTKLYHHGIYHKRQTLRFNAHCSDAALHITLLQGTLELSHTTLEAKEQITIPHYQTEITIVNHARFIVKEITL